MRRDTQRRAGVGMALMITLMLVAVVWGARSGVNTFLPQVGFLLGAALCLGYAMVCLSSIYPRLTRIYDFAARVGDGDLTAVTGLAGGDDELAALGQALDLALQKLRARILALQVAQQAAPHAPEAPEAAIRFDAGCQQAVSGLERLQARAAAVHGRAQGFSQGLETARAVSQDTTRQINIIIGSTEEMSATIADIAANAERARTVVGTAVANVNAASSRVDELGAAALEISKVTDVIVEIAEQTKLLALNATIEAARAGEAGKGFAVVANEVKELALQTNNAIAEIKNKVEAMQQSTDNTITEIGAINQTIRSVNEIVVSIAGAVEEQSVTTKDIVAKLSQGEGEFMRIHETVREAAAEALEITKDAGEASEAAQTLGLELAALTQQGGGLTQTVEAMRARAVETATAAERVQAGLAGLTRQTPQ